MSVRRVSPEQLAEPRGATRPPRRVALVCEFPTLLGGERSMLATFPYLSAAGYEPVVIAPPQGPLAQALAEQGIAHEPLEMRSAQQTHRLPLAELREHLAQRLQRLRPVLLHANSLSMGRVTGPVAAEMALPSLAHLRDILTLPAAQIADLNRHRRLLAVSDAVRRWHLAQGLDEAKVAVLHNGVDLTRFCPTEPTGFLHDELGLDRSALLVGTIGQIVLRKGHDTLATAAAALAATMPSAHYVLIGECHSQKGEAVAHLERVRATFADAGLARRVHWLGTRGDVVRIMPELALLVHPARQEPLGRVLLEAAAAGVPIVATDTGGTSEIFPAQWHAARLVPPDRPVELADAIHRLLENPAERRQLGSAARRRAEDAFGIPQAAAGLVAHYQAATT